MRSRGVVIGNPRRDGAAGMADAEAKALVERFVAHSPVEALDLTVLHWLPRRDVVPVDVVVLRPGEDGVEGELGAVSRHDHAGLAASGDEACRGRPGRDAPAGGEALRCSCVVDDRAGGARQCVASRSRSWASEKVRCSAYEEANAKLLPVLVIAPRLNARTD